MMEKQELHKWCTEHVHRYVLAHTKDGLCCDGFIEHIDETHVYLAVPYCGSGHDTMRAYAPYGAAVPPYGVPYPGSPFVQPPLYPYPYYPRRRFLRTVFPLAALLGLSLLPYY
ncbi:hypothetical protein [Paenibacillus tarimensis]|uniref:hypothetical protein n=2 Tax=Paenibacillus tarimensis TaxID=416012 RepID=UPI0039F11243|nr:hypothetical protein [Paenibacillus tarimensis]